MKNSPVCFQAFIFWLFLSLCIPFSASAQQAGEQSYTDRYGYGFSVEEGAAGKVVGHGGGFPGLNGNLDIFVDKGYTVVVLSNYDNGASPLARRIYEMVGSIREN